MTTRRKITVSSGDMALILGRYKSEHYLRLPAGETLESGDIIDIDQKRADGSSVSIPLIVTESTPVHSNRPLSALEEWRAGRVSQKTPKQPSPTVSAQRWNALLPDLGRRMARQFVTRAEPVLPTELYADDIAGNATSHPIHRFSFTLKRSPDELDSLDSLYRRFKAAYVEQEPRVRYAHTYRFNNHGTNHEFLSAPQDPSDLWAMRYLERHQRPVALEKILARLREPYEHLTQLSRAINASRPQYIPRADPDGVNKILAGVPSIPCSLDTGSLAMMGAITHIAVRHPLPEPTATRPSLTAILYATSRKTAVSSHARDFQVPVEVDTRPDSAHLFHSSAIDSPIAKKHGFATAKDMRHGLGLAPAEECTIVSYPFSLARAEALPLNGDREGKEIIRRKHAARKVMEQKDDAHKRASRFLSTLSSEARVAAEANITLPGDYTPEMTDLLAPPEMNARGTRQLPNDVLATRHRDANGSNPPSPKPRRPARNQQGQKREITLHGFDGLAGAVAKAGRRDAPTPPRLKPHRPSKEKTERTGLSPIITTSEDVLTEHHMERHSNREGLDKDGVPIISAPSMPKHKTLENGARQAHIERAREAKKPHKDPREPSRREELRYGRRKTADIVRSFEKDPELAGEDAPQGLRWTDHVLESPKKRER